MNHTLALTLAFVFSIGFTAVAAWHAGATHEAAHHTCAAPPAPACPPCTCTPCDAPPEPPRTGWRFVSIEDLTPRSEAQPLGLVIDAIEIITPDGRSHFASTVEDFNISHPLLPDVAQTLGAPNSTCPNDEQATALGGQGAGGYVIVGFSNSGQYVTFGTGSKLILHTPSGTACLPNRDAMRFRLGVSTSSARHDMRTAGLFSPNTTIPITFAP